MPIRDTKDETAATYGAWGESVSGQHIAPFPTPAQTWNKVAESDSWKIAAEVRCSAGIGAGAWKVPLQAHL